MPGPALYIFGAVGLAVVLYAFKEFVYEPHIAPQVEVVAESFLENRRRHRQRRQRINPIPAQPHRDHDESNAGDGNEIILDDLRRGQNLTPGPTVASFTSGHDLGGLQDGLRSRPRGNQDVMKEPNRFVPFSPMTPTHVIADPSTPTSPAYSYTEADEERSMAGSPTLRPAHSIEATMNAQTSPTPDFLSISSSTSLELSRSATPNAASPRSSRVYSPDVPDMYATALMESPEGPFENGVDVIDHSLLSPRIHSPLSDESFSLAALSPTLSELSITSPPHLSGSDYDFEMPSDLEDNLSSPRSGIFSPEYAGHHIDITLDDASDWASIRRRP